MGDDSGEWVRLAGKAGLINDRVYIGEVKSEKQLRELMRSETRSRVRKEKENGT